jgi:hypothetical protein
MACKEMDMIDSHYLRCGRQNLLRNHGIQVENMSQFKCQGGTGVMLTDMSSRVAWIPGLQYTGVVSDLTTRTKTNKRPFSAETAVEEAAALRRIFMHSGKCLCDGQNRSIKPCHSFEMIWPHLPEGRRSYSFDGCCPRLVVGMLEAYAADVEEKQCVKLHTHVHLEIRAACMQAVLQLNVWMEEPFAVCDNLITLADIYRSKGFVEKELQCYRTLTSLSWDQPSRECRDWMSLHAAIGKARDILEPVGDWRLDLRGRKNGKNNNDRVIDSVQVACANELVTTALRYITKLSDVVFPTFVVGGEQKFLDTHVRTLYLKVRVLSQNFRNTMTDAEETNILEDICEKIEKCGKQILGLVKNNTPLYLYYAICVTNVSCYCRGRLGVRCEQTMAVLEQLIYRTQEIELLDKLDLRRRKDIKIEQHVARLELCYMHKIQNKRMDVDSCANGAVHVATGEC